MDHHQHLEWPQIVANVRAHESGQRDLALVTAEDGNPVFPVCPDSKKPLIAGSFKNATTDVAHIKTWWKRWHYAQ